VVPVQVCSDLAPLVHLDLVPERCLRARKLDRHLADQGNAQAVPGSAQVAHPAHVQAVRPAVQAPVAELDAQAALAAVDDQVSRAVPAAQAGEELLVRSVAVEEGVQVGARLVVANPSARSVKSLTTWQHRPLAASLLQKATARRSPFLGVPLSRTSPTRLAQTPRR